LQKAIALPCVPHFTTLQKASRRLLTLDRVRRLIDKTVGRIRGRSRVVAYAAVDSSGFDAHHASLALACRRAGTSFGALPLKRREKSRKRGFLTSVTGS
jgi:hypothetical protein